MTYKQCYIISLTVSYFITFNLLVLVSVNYCDFSTFILNKKLKGIICTESSFRLVFLVVAISHFLSQGHSK
jgi:hypothetical protein